MNGSNYRPRVQNQIGHSDSNQDFDLKAKKTTIEAWIKNGIDKSTIDFSNQFARFIANDLTTSQIRTVFGEMRRIQMNNYIKEKTSFLLLKPKLAYAVKRHKSKGLSKFYDLFSIAYDAVNTSDDKEGEPHFANMMNLLESILAYHKFHGGKE
jgi:CRISPR-associated protein Csm2